MPGESIEVDVAVIGAGTTGAAVAGVLARAGRRVALLEKQSFRGAGARWINALPAWMFDAAGLDRPAGEELVHTGGPLRMLSPSGRAHLALAKTPVWDVRMERLVERLQRQALAAGALAFEQVRLGELGLEGGRPVTLEARGCRVGDEPTGQTDLGFRARLFVDASGQAAALRERLPGLSGGWPLVPDLHTCQAAQQVCAIRDRVGAARYLQRCQAEAGTLVAHTGIEGGWSIRNLRVDPDFETVELLAGCIATPDRPSGIAMLEACRQDEPWIGTPLASGAGRIRLRRPYDRLVAPGVALVGESGCQVFGLHGSGTGAGLVAARLLGEAVAQADDPGADEPLWEYQRRAQRELGAVQAAYDLLRRFLQACDPGQIELLLSSGLLHAGAVQAGLDQRLPGPGQLGLSRVPLALARAPGLAASLGPVLARMGAVVALYKAFPARPSKAALAGWSKRAAWMFGDPPDQS